jgi:hypothetical protein
MRHSGCLQPIRVQATSDGDYQLVAGERRYRAAALAALTEIPASVLPAGTGEDSEQPHLLVEAMIETSCAATSIVSSGRGAIRRCSMVGSMFGVQLNVWVAR